MTRDRFREILTPEIRALAKLFADEGHELYLVGGSVRDVLLERDVSDLDFTTRARPDDIERIGDIWASSLFLAGKDFGTIGLVHDGQVHEITTFRSEVYRGDSRKPSVTYGDSLTDDLSRRDFTVNAMALLVPTGADEDPLMEDPYDGLTDLMAGVLRTPGPPEELFSDDPLRMLRLFRFMSTLGFTPDPAALRAVADMADRLEIISAERIRAEFDKLMVGAQVVPALEALIESGLADYFIPEIPALAVEQDPVHRHKDVLAHTIAVVGKTDKDRDNPRLEVRLAALFHDIGKPATREFGKGGVSFHHHEVVGARMARKRMKALRYPKHVIEDVGNLVFLHMRPHTYKMGWTDAAVRRYVRDAGPLLDQLNELVRCDVTTRNKQLARSISRRIDELEERIVFLREQEELDSLRPPIDGNQVMEYLGLEPSREVGRIMNMLLEKRIEDGPYSEEEAFAILDDWNTGE
ncbi:MAG: CCA tRNA nucleotidyltransferase [Acidimicrobiia bacterium]|nr:CCA tRNA nucleotidyltransferase [Acidimicrobiia bacterium]